MNDAVRGEAPASGVVDFCRRPGGRLGLLVLCAVALVAVWLGFLFFPTHEAGRWVRRCGYYTMALTFAWWVASLVNVVRARGPLRAGLRPGWWRAPAGAAGLTLVALVTAPWIYKVLYDELVIQTTAMTLSQDRAVGAIGRAYELWDKLQISFDYLDKRPFFYPFLVSLLHDLTGYRVANAFILNALLMPVSLLLAHAIARRAGGPGAGRVAMVSLGAFSLLALNATGAGLEMLNLALVLGLVWTGGHYLEKPDEPARLSLLVLTAVLLANTRYESGIYIGTTALVVLEGWRRIGRVELSAAALAAPLLLVPYAWHNTYLSGMPVLWELRPGQEARFSIDYFAHNLRMAGKYFGNFGPGIANSPWLTWAGAVALVGWMGRRAWQRRKWADVDAMEWSLVACGLGVLGNLGLLLAYYWGDLSDPIVSRLALPLHALLAILIGGAVAWWARAYRPGAVREAVVAALVCYTVWGLPTNQSLSDYNHVETLQGWQLGVVEKLPPRTRLVITDRSPLFWFTHGVSSTAPARVHERLAGLGKHWAWGSFDEILVMQELVLESPDGELVPRADSALPEAVKLERVAQTRISGRVHRISRVVEIEVDEAEARPPASEDQ